MLSGEVVPVTNTGDEVLLAGDRASFKGGDPDGHCLQNRGTTVATVLEIASRIAGEGAAYPDIDLRAESRGGHMHKDGTPYPKAERRGPD